ncbi:MAG: efflux RND transporter periplasmic adaptor subunit [Defluviitaleaceae bacterium]|nr:efflux RND transporter periplasmic adaptor subunit [Defluviitaleaceae bacterium]
MENQVKKKSKKAIVLGVIIALITLGGGAFAAYIILAGQRYINTGNARVTTDLITITPLTPGLLERFNVYEGMQVETGQILGWIQNGETFRSPVSGIVVDTNAVTGQYIMPMQPLATIADTSNIHIQANIYETDIQDIQLGQPVAVTLDGLGNQTFGGYVRSISRITQVELAGGVIAVQMGTTFRRITHTVPIEIALTSNVDLSYFLGTNARVSLPVLPPGTGLVEIETNNGTQTEITAIGRVESIVNRNVYSSHTLRIENVLVRTGDFVEAGQILATLDMADLETAIATQRAAINQTAQHNQLQSQETRRMLYSALENINNNTNMHIINAQASLTASTLQLENAQRMYAQARLDYENRTNPQVVATDSALRVAQLELERLTADYSNMTILYNIGALPQQEIIQIRNALTLTQNQYNDATTNYQNALEAEQRQLEQMRVALDSAITAYESAIEIERSVEIAVNQEIESLQATLQMAQVDGIEQMHHSLAQMERHLQEGVITAPTSGTITAAHAEPGEFSATRLFTIECLNELRVLANVREYDLPGIYIGQSVTVTAYATGRQVHTGVITGISPRAVSTFPVVEFEIEIRITSESYLRPGMSARVSIAGANPRTPATF